MATKKATPVKKPRTKKPDLRVVDVLDPVREPSVRKEEPPSFLNRKETLIVNLCLLGAFLSMAVFLLFIFGVV